MTRRLMFIAAAGLAASLTACAGSGTTVTPTAGTTPSTAAIPGQGVAVEKGLPFATYNGDTLTLDLSLPGDPTGAPIVVRPPWMIANDLVQAGAIVVAIQRGVPHEDEASRYVDDHGAHIRARAEAAACAIRFARARAAELGSDDPLVAVGGLSNWGGEAAHVALFGATLEEAWDEFAAAVGGPPDQVECLVADGSTEVDALVGSAGAYDVFVPAFEGLYGLTYVQERDPELQQFLASALGAHPELVVRLFHGTADDIVPVTMSEDFAATLADAGYDVQLTTFDGGHADPPPELSLPVYKEVLGL